MTVIDINIYHYRFMTRVIKLYLKDAVNLSPFVTLSTF